MPSDSTPTEPGVSPGGPRAQGAGVSPSTGPWAHRPVPPDTLALPASLRAPSARELVRTWRPAALSEANAAAHARFEADGTWRGSDGCNAQAGTWRLATNGQWAGRAGLQTQIGCDNIDIGSWIAAAALAGLTPDGAELVFLTAEGRELGRLVAR